MEVFKVDAVTGMRRLFYAVTPNETSFETLDEVPPYVVEAAPFFLLTVIIEEILLRIHDGGKGDRLIDGLTSMISGQFMIVTGLLSKGLELAAYVWVYENYCLYPMAWNSIWTWVVSFLMVDLGYYWFHRSAHEVNIMWAAHQVHHSSEEYNLSTATRQSIFQRCTSWIFYLPLAFFAPPSSLFVHMQFNTLYQFWIHTELISTLGPLEYILNTPSHHRVHHGRNRYCIDKNYAGTLIIWDRMFGTFAAEDERVAYGLTHPLQTYHPITVQMVHFQWVWSQFWSTPGLMNKLRVIFYGPGWGPGKPRTGLIEDIPDVKGPADDKYRTPIPGWLRAYVVLHFIISTVVMNLYVDFFQTMSQLNAAVGMLYIIYTITCLGMLCDLKPWWNVLAEMARCAFVVAATSLAMHHNIGSHNALLAVQVTFGLSLGFWVIMRGASPSTGKEKAT